MINFVWIKSKAIKKEEKKRLKAELKLRKKEVKASSVSGNSNDSHEKKSHLVKFAESIRGIIYIITGASLMIVIILGQSGAFITMNDIVENLMLATIGKFVLIIIAFALIIYGFKNLRFLK